MQAQERERETQRGSRVRRSSNASASAPSAEAAVAAFGVRRSSNASASAPSAEAAVAAFGQRIGGAKPGYVQADSQGNFELLSDTTRESSRRTFDVEDAEPDSSERFPGGPVAEAVRAAGPEAQRFLWIAPLAAFLGALLLQSLGLHAATHRYVYNVSHMQGWPEGGPLVAAEEDLYGPVRFATSGLRDNFAAGLGAEPKGASGLAVPALAGLVPLLWLAAVLASGNLRIWSRTLAVGSILAVLKGLCTWMTLIPEPLGWTACRERLHPWALAYFQGETQFFKAVPLVIWLWLQDVVLGMRGEDSLVCATSFSGPSCLCTLFTVSLCDVLRAATRKLRPWQRALSRWAAALLLAFLVLADARLELTSGRQYSAGVALALVLPLLLYSSPEVALATDFFLKWGSDAKTEEGFDVGDVLVPPCCVPFCCFSGRYFLYTQPAEEIEELLRNRAESAKALESLRQDQEDTAWRLLESEAQLEYVRQRTQVRERQDAVEAERSLAEKLLVQQKAHEASLSGKMAAPEASAGAAVSSLRDVHRAEAAPASPFSPTAGTPEASPFFSRHPAPAWRGARAAGAPQEAETARRDADDLRQDNLESEVLRPAAASSGAPAARPPAEATVERAEVGEAQAAPSLVGDFRSTPALWEACHARFRPAPALIKAETAAKCDKALGDSADGG